MLCKSRMNENNIKVIKTQIRSSAAIIFTSSFGCY
uniref:Uncharacterized protein n=1 Tax=Rhizophora mucronata TaxID=61149 RepID=A0A2P2NSF8_RHIMU